MATKKKKASKKKGKTVARRKIPGGMTLVVTKGVETSDGKGHIWGGQLLGKSGKGPGLPVGSVVCHTKPDAVKRLHAILRRHIAAST